MEPDFFSVYCCYVFISVLFLIDEVKADDDSFPFEYFSEAIILLILICILMIIMKIIGCIGTRRMKRAAQNSILEPTTEAVHTLPSRTDPRTGTAAAHSQLHRRRENEFSTNVVVRASPPSQPIDMLPPPPYSSIVIEEKPNIEIWEEPPPYNEETMNV